MKHGERSRWQLPLIVGLVVLALLIGFGVYWFAFRDDGKKAPTVQGPQTFTQSGIPFTFEYPANFALTTGPAGYIWIGGIGPYDILDVKRIANETRSVAKLHNTTRAALKAQSGVSILSEGQQVVSGTTMVTFVASSSINGLPLHSQLYYFSAGGVTWQFECESQAKEPAIDAACAQAIASFRVS